MAWIPSPDFSCVEGEWSQRRPFAWGERIDASWDEGVNCNLYAERFEEKLASSQINPGSETVDFRGCPVSTSACKGRAEVYGMLAPRVLSSECLGAGSK
jgi:hypothetical protein